MGQKTKTDCLRNPLGLSLLGAHYKEHLQDASGWKCLFPVLLKHLLKAPGLVKGTVNFPRNKNHEAH